MTLSTSTSSLRSSSSSLTSLKFKSNSEIIKTNLPIPPITTTPINNLLKRNLKASIREGLCGALAGSAQVAGLMWLRTTMSYQHKHRLTMKGALTELYRQGIFYSFISLINFHWK